MAWVKANMSVVKVVSSKVVSFILEAIEEHIAMFRIHLEEDGGTLTIVEEVEFTLNKSTKPKEVILTTSREVVLLTLLEAIFPKTQEGVLMTPQEAITVTSEYGVILSRDCAHNRPLVLNLEGN